MLFVCLYMWSLSSGERVSFDLGVPKGTGVREYEGKCLLIILIFLKNEGTGDRLFSLSPVP
jgi:hypothetical protein